jgi:hypothetical protein
MSVAGDIIGELLETRQVLANLVDKLDAMHRDPQYMTAWVLLADHGVKYVGPNVGEELAAAKEVLEYTVLDDL